VEGQRRRVKMRRRQEEEGESFIENMRSEEKEGQVGRMAGLYSISS
jgi:hypothetical protein